MTRRRTEPKVHFVQDGALGTVILDSPPLNLIGDELVADLQAVIDQVEAADGLRALLLRGNGKVFSAGADVAMFAGMDAAQLRPLIASFLDLGGDWTGCPSRLSLRSTGPAWPGVSNSHCSAIWSGRRRARCSVCQRPGWGSFP